MHPEDREALREWIILKYTRELRETGEFPVPEARWLTG